MQGSANWFSMLSTVSAESSRLDVSEDGTPSLDVDTHAQSEFALLNGGPIVEDPANNHATATAPVMSRDAFIRANGAGRKTQYGVLGSIDALHGSPQENFGLNDDRRLYISTNAPFSAVVCGVQGSGKSHTVATMLESMLIEGCPKLGRLEKSLSGLVFHYGEGGHSARASEAAALGSAGTDDLAVPAVKVYVSKSSLTTMHGVYAHLGSGVIVEPLLFNSGELDSQAILSMMAVASTDSAPLYMHMVLSILRNLGEKFDYNKFQTRLKDEKFTPLQLASLQQRLSLLDCFVDKRNSSVARPRFKAGQLTIVDLSDPFIDPSSACALFEIVVRLFVRANVDTGKVLVVDEAHKYLTRTQTSAGLTSALLSLVRQQRHLAMRIIISTQEPTVIPPVLLDLCTVTIIHRFSSPAWWRELVEHTSADFSEQTFDQVVKLQTGQAIVMAPSALVVLQEIDGSGQHTAKLHQLARRYLLVTMRRRVTADEGASVMVLTP